MKNLESCEKIVGADDYEADEIQMSWLRSLKYGHEGQESKTTRGDRVLERRHVSERSKSNRNG